MLGVGSINRNLHTVFFWNHLRKECFVSFSSVDETPTDSMCIDFSWKHVEERSNRKYRSNETNNIKKLEMFLFCDSINVLHGKSCLFKLLSARELVFQRSGSFPSRC